MTDAQAIGASLADPEAFAVLFDRHFDAIHGYAQRRVGPDLADEIAAETFTRAFDRRRRYDSSRDDARPWLLGIATNLLRTTGGQSAAGSTRTRGAAAASTTSSPAQLPPSSSPR